MRRKRGLVLREALPAEVVALPGPLPCLYIGPLYTGTEETERRVLAELEAELAALPTEPGDCDV